MNGSETLWANRAMESHVLFETLTATNKGEETQKPLGKSSTPKPRKVKKNSSTGERGVWHFCSRGGYPGTPPGGHHSPPFSSHSTDYSPGGNPPRPEVMILISSSSMPGAAQMARGLACCSSLDLLCCAVLPVSVIWWPYCLRARVGKARSVSTRCAGVVFEDWENLFSKIRFVRSCAR